MGASPPGPQWGHTYYLNNFESPTPKDDFCQVWLNSNHAFSRRRWKCKKFTDDGRRKERTAIAHLSLRLRWAKNHERYYAMVRVIAPNWTRGGGGGWFTNDLSIYVELLGVCTLEYFRCRLFKTMNTCCLDVVWSRLIVSDSLFKRLTIFISESAAWRLAFQWWLPQFHSMRHLAECK